MSTSKIRDDVDVPVSELGASTNKIKTNYLGPCLAFLMDFMFDGTNVCTLFHYTFSINEKESKTQSNLLVKILEYIVGELQHCLDIDEFISNGKAFLSNMNLLIAGGDTNKSQRTENALCMLNSDQNNFNIKSETDDEDMNFIYHELINKVRIVQPVSKILSTKDEADENFPKNVILHLMWYLSDPNVEIGILQFNLISQQISQAKWQLNEEIINNLKISYEHVKPKQERLQQALALIPSYPFIILPDLTKFTSSLQAASINFSRGDSNDSDYLVDSDNPNKKPIQTSISMTSMSSSSTSTDPGLTFFLICLK